MGLRTRARMLLVGGVVATALFTALVGTGQATFPGDDGRIVFQNPGGGAFFTIAPNGSNQTRIPRTGPHNGINSDPSFSDTSKWIVFSHTHSRQGRTLSSIVRMRPDGSHRTTILLRHGLYFFDPSSSPGFERIVFLFKQDVYAVRSTGGDVHQLTGTPGHDQDPSYSPNGKLIVWNVGNRIRTMHSNGSHKRTVARGSHFGEPSFSPDGEHILFTGGPTKFDTAVTDVQEMNVDGSDRHHVTNDASATFVYHSPHFSPQGTRIVATGTNPTPECNNCDQVQIMTANGGNRHPLTQTASFSPDWGPAAG